MTVRSRCALLAGLVPAGAGFSVGGSSGVVRGNGVVRWAAVEVRYGVPAPPGADRQGVRR